MYLVVNTEDLIYALKPQYICMTGLDGRCEVNEYPTAHPRTVRDASKGYYVKEDGTTIAVGDDFITSRTNYETLTEICGTKEVRSDSSWTAPGGVVAMAQKALVYNVIFPVINACLVRGVTFEIHNLFEKKCLVEAC